MNTFDMTYLNDPKKLEAVNSILGKNNFEILFNVLLQDKCYKYLRALFEEYKVLDSNWNRKFAFYELRADKKIINNDDNLKKYLNPQNKELIYLDENNAEHPFSLPGINDKLSDNDANEMLRHLESINAGFGELGFDSFDTAGEWKIIRYRLYQNERSQPYKFERWFIPVAKTANYIGNLRNALEGHSAKKSKEEIISAERFYEYGIKDNIHGNICTCAELIEKLEAVTNSNAVPSVKDAAQELIDEIKALKEAEEFLVDGVTIPWDYKGMIDFRYIANYNIFLTPTSIVTIGDDDPNADRSFFNNICSFVKKLNGRYRLSDEENEYKANIKRGVCFYEDHFNFFEKLKKGRQFKNRFKNYGDVIRYVPGKASPGEVADRHPDTDPFIKFFRDKEDKYCIITGSWDTAMAIRELNKDNIIALIVPKDHQDKLEVFSEKMVEELKRESPGTRGFDFGIKYLNAILERIKPKEDEWLKKLEYYEPKNEARVYYNSRHDDVRHIIYDEKDKSREGGEGYVVEVKEDPNRCIKIYKNEKWSEETLEKVHQMIEDKLWANKDLIKDPSHTAYFPINLVYSDNQLIGYEMFKAPEGAKTVHEIVCAPESNKITRRGLARICQRSVEVLKRLHDHDIFMGDINLKNIMAKKRERSEDDYDVYFIDVDSYQYKDMLCPVGVEDFASPRLLQEKENGLTYLKRNKNDEFFSEVVFIFEILFLEDFPYKIDGDIPKQILSGKYRFGRKTRPQDKNFRDNVNHINENLSGELRQLFEDIFCSDPKYDEYTEEKLISILNNYYDQINPKISDYYHHSDYKYDAENNLSNEILPSSSPEGKWLAKKCDCGQEFWTTDEYQRSCTLCKDKFDRERGQIHFVICPECGIKFTVNGIDWNKNSPEGRSDDGIMEDGTYKYVSSPIKCSKCEGKTVYSDDNDKIKKFTEKNGLGNKELRDAVLNYFNSCLKMGRSIKVAPSAQQDIDDIAEEEYWEDEITEEESRNE